MEAPFKVGDVVMQRDGSQRMKVSKIEKEEGRVRCTWTRGPAKRTQSFAVDDLTTLVKPRAL